MTHQLQLADALRQSNAALEQRVRERTTELELANSELEAFSYSVSHDLRAPLRAINGYLDLLLEERSGELSAACLYHLHSAADAAAQMGRMMEDLLRLSMTGPRAPRLAPVDLSTMVLEIMQEIQALHPRRCVTLVIEPEAHAYCDSSLMRIALHNLLENAWKYTAATPAARIEFGSCSEECTTTWFIRDNGIGFDMAEAERLFIAFQRLSSAHCFAGTGIGLATVRRVIHAHGGTVSAKSNPGAGATFYFTLPSESNCNLAGRKSVS